MTMEPLNRPNRNREEANGESMIPVERQPDDLRTRIAAVLNANLPVMEYLRPGDTERAAEAVIRELGLRPERVELLHRYVTEWELTDD